MADRESMQQADWNACLTAAQGCLHACATSSHELEGLMTAEALGRLTCKYMTDRE